MDSSATHLNEYNVSLAEQRSNITPAGATGIDGLAGIGGTAPNVDFVAHLMKRSGDRAEPLPRPGGDQGDDAHRDPELQRQRGLEPGLA